MPKQSDRVWRVSREKSIQLSDLARPAVVGILNVSPDSFHGASVQTSVEVAVASGMRMVEEGAVAIDIGGESTRPGSERVDKAEQIRRVVPMIEGIRASREIQAAGMQSLATVPILIDTTRAAVARAALDAGADAINDVSGGTDDVGMLPLVAKRGCGVILMHRAVLPVADRYSDQYGTRNSAVPPMGTDVADVFEAVLRFLSQQVRAALDAGVMPEGITLDPGLGFGKTVEQNLALIAATRGLSMGISQDARIKQGIGERAGQGECEREWCGWPILSALSRKSFVGRISLGRDSSTQERLEGTLGLSVTHGLFGASMYRVHDVQEHVRALRAGLSPALTLANASAILAASRTGSDSSLS